MKDNIKSQQHKAHFLYMTWCANEMANAWIWLSELILRIRTRPTKETLHPVFKAILEKMQLVKSINDVTKQQYSEAVDVWMDTMAEIGIHIPFPDQDKKNLLDNF